MEKTQKIGLMLLVLMIISCSLSITALNFKYQKEIIKNESYSDDTDNHKSILVAQSMRQFRQAARICENYQEKQEIEVFAVSYLLANQKEMTMFESYLINAVPNDLINWHELKKQDADLAEETKTQLIKKLKAELDFSRRLSGPGDTEQQRHNRCLIAKQKIFDLINRGIANFSDFDITQTELGNLS